MNKTSETRQITARTTMQRSDIIESDLPDHDSESIQSCTSLSDLHHLMDVEKHMKELEQHARRQCSSQCTVCAPNHRGLLLGGNPSAPEQVANGDAQKRMQNTYKGVVLGQTMTSAMLEEQDMSSLGFEVKELVKEGQYSRVYSGKVKSFASVFDKPVFKKYKKKQCAVKAISKDLAAITLGTDHDVAAQYIARELAILSTAQSHANVVKFIDHYETFSHIYLFMERCREDLHNYVFNRGRLQVDEARTFFIQVIEGLIHLHKKGIAHRDMKCENILIDYQNRAKIADFGLAAITPNKRKLLRTGCGSISYAAPELIKEEQYDGILIDTWAVGVVLYVMMHGTYPFNTSRKESLLADMYMQRLAFGYYCSLEYRMLIREILQWDPIRRLRPAYILKHPWTHGKKIKPGQVPFRPKYRCSKRFPTDLDGPNKHDMRIQDRQNTCFSTVSLQQGNSNIQLKSRIPDSKSKRFLQGLDTAASVRKNLKSALAKNRITPSPAGGRNHSVEKAGVICKRDAHAALDKKHSQSFGRKNSSHDQLRVSGMVLSPEKLQICSIQIIKDVEDDAVSDDGLDDKNVQARYEEKQVETLDNHGSQAIEEKSTIDTCTDVVAYEEAFKLDLCDLKSNDNERHVQDGDGDAKCGMREEKEIQHGESKLSTFKTHSDLEVIQTDRKIKQSALDNNKVPCIGESEAEVIIHSERDTILSKAAEEVATECDTWTPLKAEEVPTECYTWTPSNAAEEVPTECDTWTMSKAAEEVPTDCYTWTPSNAAEEVPTECDTSSIMAEEIKGKLTVQSARELLRLPVKPHKLLTCLSVSPVSYRKVGRQERGMEDNSKSRGDDNEQEQPRASSVPLLHVKRNHKNATQRKVQEHNTNVMQQLSKEIKVIKPKFLRENGKLAALPSYFLKKSKAMPRSPRKLKKSSSISSLTSSNTGRFESKGCVFIERITPEGYSSLPMICGSQRQITNSRAAVIGCSRSSTPRESHPRMSLTKLKDIVRTSYASYGHVSASTPSPRCTPPAMMDSHLKGVKLKCFNKQPQKYHGSEVLVPVCRITKRDTHRRKVKLDERIISCASCNPTSPVKSNSISLTEVLRGVNPYSKSPSPSPERKLTRKFM